MENTVITKSPNEFKDEFTMEELEEKLISLNEEKDKKIKRIEEVMAERSKKIESQKDDMDFKIRMEELNIETTKIVKIGQVKVETFNEEAIALCKVSKSSLKEFIKQSTIIESVYDIHRRTLKLS